MQLILPVSFDNLAFYCHNIHHQWNWGNQVLYSEMVYIRTSLKSYHKNSSAVNKHVELLINFANETILSTYATPRFIHAGVFVLILLILAKKILLLLELRTWNVHNGCPVCVIPGKLCISHSTC